MRWQRPVTPPSSLLTRWGGGMDTTHDADVEKKQPPPFKGPTPLPPLFSNRICHVFTQARQLGSHLLEQRSFLLAYKLYSMGQIFCFYYTNQDKNERAYLPQDLSLSRIQITRSKPQVSNTSSNMEKALFFSSAVVTAMGSNVLRTSIPR